MMRRNELLNVLLVLSSFTVGCDPPSVELDGGILVDGETFSADAGGAFDAGPPQPCDVPGAVERVACGACGTVERFCSAERTWAYGLCEGEGACIPGTSDSMMCGNCGTQTARCTSSCTWDVTGFCVDEGECAPGATTRSADGCPAGETRDLTCTATCAFEPSGVCEVDGCSTPGAVEMVPCGTMCGMQERFCTAGMTWEYGTCGGGGVCTPGTLGTESCGNCGSQVTRCTPECAWAATGTCAAEGECAPADMRRTAAGCPLGQTQAQRCGATCGWETIESCRIESLVDVTLLLDVTGSHGSRVRDQVALIRSRLLTPLFEIANVAVGVSYYGDFPVSPYGATGDQPFRGGVEPSLSAASINAELGAIPTMLGGDDPESGIQALDVLTGGTLPASARALTCSAGRIAGGCWRPGARRIVVLWTDALQHNGPGAGSATFESSYVGISPAPALWNAGSTLGAMRAQGVELLVLSTAPRKSVTGLRSLYFAVSC